MKIEVPLLPESYPRREVRGNNPMPRSLDGITLGVLHNGKAGGDKILRGLEQRFTAAHPGATVRHQRKPLASLAMSDREQAAMADCDLVLTAVGDCGSCSSLTIHDAVALEKAGVPTIAVCTKPFATFARAQAKSLGLADLRVLILDHPVAELPEEAIRERLTPALGQFDAFLSGDASTGPHRAGDEPAEITSTETVEAADVMPVLEERGLFDGLPLIAPTPALVDEMLAAHPGPHHAFLGRVGPRYGVATPRNIAAAAVAAGCLPAYFPVVLAAVKAILDPSFNLSGVQATTHPVAMFALVSGPITAEIGMNAGTNAFGHGNRANATIGRALRLSALALGGAWPGNGDMATQGTPAKYTFTAAENVERSPWGSLASSLGHSPDANVVTVVGSEGPQNINDHRSSTGLGLLRTMAGTMRSVGMNQHYYPHGQVVVAIGPEHAHTIADQGYTRREIQDYLFAEARIPVSYFSAENVEHRLKRTFPREFSEYGAHTTVPIVHDPANILVCVVGGVGKHSAFIPTFGGTRACTVAI
jgi:hypothetical protein